MDISTILFFVSFIFIAVMIFWTGTFPYSLMINKQYFGIEKRKVLIWCFGFNLIFLILWIFSRLLSVELVRILNYYIGIVAILVTVGTLYWFIEFILYLFKHASLLDRKSVKKFFLGFTLLLFCLSIYNFEKPVSVENYTIESSKLDRDYRFVHISDIQFGTVRKDYMDDVLDLAISQNPEFIVFTGDLIDFEGYEKSDFDKFKELPVPLYFERGNHEFYHFPEKILEYLMEIDTIKLLINQKVDFDGIEITGVDHTRDKEIFESVISNLDLDDEKFSIFLYHEPRHVDFAVSKGFDLLLYGHTHAGQIFPATLFVDWFYEYSDGFYELNGSKIYTTDGAALWGPKMRLGSQNEIVVFNLKKID